MAKNLVIVESPAKAKTIENFLGSEFLVKSCFGHVRDLAEKVLSVDVENGFEPSYHISEDKKKVVSELKKLATDAEMVWLATDEDREGEAISWHLQEALELVQEKTKRIVFHEITKNAILKAIESPRGIDKKLVDAQQARRVLDRLVGYELSPVLWKKIKPALSAGRVQSVAVRIIVEREREIEAFQPKASYKVTAEFLLDNEQKSVLKAELPNRISSEDEAREFLQKCAEANFQIKDLEVKPGKKSPSPPFTTSTLQQEASRKMGYSVARTMMLAQRLYESGHITYMRTDSVNLSDTAMDAAKSEISSKYGNEYSSPRTFQTKSKGAQEAHEAIRPTTLSRDSVTGESAEQKLYELIWKRTIASQMSDAELERTVITIDVSTSDKDFMAKGEVIKFDGFLRVYFESKEDENDEETQGVLPQVATGDRLNLQTVVAVQRYSKPAARYSEAALVKKLEELGIGRPSTFAPTISTIQKREYVVKEDRDGIERVFNELTLSDGQVVSTTKTEITGREKSKLFPSEIGITVNDYLVENFEKVLDYNFTANVEKEFDEIAQGQKKWNSMIDEFYGPFHKEIEDNLKDRILGTDPESGKQVSLKAGRYGPYVQIDAGDDEKPKSASLMKGQRADKITLEEALELFKLPKILGEYEGKELLVAIGRYGPYINHDEKFYSLKKEDDPFTITKEKAIALVEEKRPKSLGEHEGHEITSGTGRFGPYVKYDNKFVSLKKTDDILTITIERAKELIEEKRDAEKNKMISEFKENKDVQVLNGRYGPYIKIGKKNFRIPKGNE